MSAELISEKFTFEEIYNLLSSKKDNFWECFDNMFSVALLFFPNIKLPSNFQSSLFNENVSLNLLSAKDKLKNCRKSVRKLLSNHNPQVYYAKYNSIQIANFLLIFAAYFDAMEMYLPDREYNINLSKKEKISITKEAIEKYLTKLQKSKDNTFIINEIPNRFSIVVPFEESKNELKKFYEKINLEFKKFFVELNCFQVLSGSQTDKVIASLNVLPDKATEFYITEYNTLKTEFAFYSSYAETQEHQKIIDHIDRAINDFKQEQMDWQYKCQNEKVENAFISLDKHYKNLINQKILYGDSRDDEETSMLPKVKDIFIPQSFKCLVYKKNINEKELRLEPDKTWENLDEYENLAEYIYDIINNPIYGRKPIIILGNPGAGKSTLCNMLAAQIFNKMYYTVVIRLREINANDEISTQIEQQIHKDINQRINWEDIQKSLTNIENKPLLLIFDGYDELLQASGQEYRNFIKSIHKFQKQNETLYGFFVRTIITSRRTLIDTADIDNDSVVINLCEFRKRRIEKWIEIWNNKNNDHFVSNNLQPLDIKEEDKYYELAQQPLLLTLLAIYDYNDNALLKNQNLDITQLYENIITSFIEREKKKSIDFLNNGSSDEIKQEFYNLNIAAIGMYNRSSTAITSKELVSDLKFFNARITEEDNNTLNKGLKVFGSFFFINTSKSEEEINRHIETRYAYEFLHNTFNEFLAGDLILKTLCDVLDETAYAKERKRAIQIPKNWYSCLLYVPLFTRANIINLMNMEAKHFTKEIARDMFNYFLQEELNKIISGDLIVKIKDIISNNNPYEKKDVFLHLSIYSINLIIISGLLFEGHNYIELSKRNWKKLLSIWKYAFDENELFNFTNLFSFTYKKDNCYSINYVGEFTESNLEEKSREYKDNLLYKIHLTNVRLHDEVNVSLTSGLVGDINKINQLKIDMLPLKAQASFNYLLNKPKSQNYLIESITIMQENCINEENMLYLSLLYNYMIQLMLEYPELLPRDFIYHILTKGIRMQRYCGENHECLIAILRLTKYISVDVNLYWEMNELFRHLNCFNKNLWINVIDFWSSNIRCLFDYRYSIKTHDIDRMPFDFSLRLIFYMLEDAHLNSSDHRLFYSIMNYLNKITGYTKKDCKLNDVLCEGVCNVFNLMLDKYHSFFKNNLRAYSYIITLIYNSLHICKKGTNIRYLEWFASIRYIIYSDKILASLHKFSDDIVCKFLEILSDDYPTGGEAYNLTKNLRKYLDKNKYKISPNVLRYILIISKKYGDNQLISMIHNIVEKTRENLI